jgi:tetratricopeptide (TPR) repeat protein
LVAVRIFAGVLFLIALAFGIWATVTGNSVLFGRLTALAGVFSLVLAVAIAASSMIAWTVQRRNSASASQVDQTPVLAEQRQAKANETTVDAGGNAQVAGRDITVTQMVNAPTIPPPKPGLLPRNDALDFIGRRNEVIRLTSLADGGSLKVAAICGTAGVGKSSLALHAAHDLLTKVDFPAGHLYVDMLGYTSGRTPLAPGEVLEVFLRRLGVTAGDMPAETEERSGLFRQLLESRRALVVLDNVREEWQVEPLLPGTGQSVVFITSRSKLSGLSADERITLDVFSDQEADRLLSSLMGPARALAESEQVAKVRDWCGCLPLALWICGQMLATHEHWTVGTLAAKLSDEHQRLDRLSIGNRKVWAAFAVSYGLLSEDDQLMFRLLGLHPGPQFDVLAAASLAGIAPLVAEEALERLTQAHLVTEHPAERFGLHDLLRLFARDTCKEIDDPATQDEALKRLISHYADLANVLARVIERHQGSRVGSATQHEWATPSRQDALALLESVRLTLVSTFHLAVGQNSDEVTWQLGESLRVVFRKLHYLDDLSSVLEDALVIARRARGSDAICSVLDELGLVSRELRRANEAIAYYDQALALRRQSGDREGEALTLSNLGMVHQDSGEVDTAVASFQQALALSEQSGNPRTTAQVLYNLGITQRVSGQLDAAVDSFQQALALCGKAGNPGNIEGKIYNNLGLAHSEQQRFEDGLAAYRLALRLSREANDQPTEAHALNNLGKAHSAVDELIDAVEALEQARKIRREIGDRKGEGQALSDLGNTYRRLQRHEESVASYQATLAIRREEGDPSSIAEILYLLADTYREMGSFRASADAYGQAQSIDPETDD